MLNFGERLRYLRTQKGLSQLEFSKQVKLSKSAINMYERGERQPNFEVLEIIADYFNVDLDFLLGKTDCRNRNKLDYSETESDSPSLSPDENQLLTGYRSLNRQGKEYMLQTLDMATRVYIKSADNPDMEEHIG